MGSWESFHKATEFGRCLVCPWGDYILSDSIYGEGIARWFYFTRMEESWRSLGCKSKPFISIMTSMCFFRNCVRCVWAFDWWNQDVLHTSSDNLILGWNKPVFSCSSEWRSFLMITIHLKEYTISSHSSLLLCITIWLFNIAMENSPINGRFMGKSSMGHSLWLC